MTVLFSLSWLDWGYVLAYASASTLWLSWAVLKIHRRRSPGDVRRVTPSALTEGARAARTPPRPEERVDALQDRIYPSSGRLRAAKAVHRPKGPRVGYTRNE